MIRTDLIFADTWDPLNGLLIRARATADTLADGRAKALHTVLTAHGGSLQGRLLVLAAATDSPGVSTEKAPKFKPYAVV